MWAKRVERWGDSGLSAREFAGEIGVNFNTLASWKRKLSGGGEKRQDVGDPPPFLEIVASCVGDRDGESITAGREREAMVEPEPLELVLRSGHRVRVPVRFDAGSLRRLVDALGTR